MRRNVREVTPTILHRGHHHAKSRKRDRRYDRTSGRLRLRAGAIHGSWRTGTRHDLPLHLVSAAHGHGVRMRKWFSSGSGRIADALKVTGTSPMSSGTGWISISVRIAARTLPHPGSGPASARVAAGTFDDPSWIDPAKQKFRYVYLRSAQHWSEVPEGVEKYEAHFRGDRCAISAKCTMKFGFLIEPPFNFRLADGTVTGCDVELAKAVLATSARLPSSPSRPNSRNCFPALRRVAGG